MPTEYCNLNCGSEIKDDPPKEPVDWHAQYFEAMQKYEIADKMVESLKNWEAKYHELLRNRNEIIHSLEEEGKRNLAKLAKVKEMYWEKVLADE